MRTIDWVGVGAGGLALATVTDLWLRDRAAALKAEASVRSDIGALQQQVAQSQRTAAAQITAQQQQLTQDQSQIQQLQGQVQTDQNQMATQQQQIRQDATTIQGLRGTVQATQAQLTQAQGTIQQLHTTISSLNTQIQQLQSQRDALQQQLTQAVQAGQTDQAQIQQLQGTIQSLDTSIATLKSQLQQAQAQAASWQQQFQALLVQQPPVLQLTATIVGQAQYYDGYYYGWVTGARVQFTLSAIYQGTSIPYPIANVQRIGLCDSFNPCTFVSPAQWPVQITHTMQYGYTFHPTGILKTTNGKTIDQSIALPIYRA